MKPSILRHSGVPTVAQFAGAPGPVMVIDELTGSIYWLAAGDVVTEVPTGGSGSSDHGALSGLADDDHAQYHNDTRGDARYLQIANASETIDDRVASLLVAGTNVTLTYDDGAGTLTIDASGGGASPVISWVI